MSINIYQQRFRAWIYASLEEIQERIPWVNNNIINILTFFKALSWICHAIV